jgi:hypothetical protein
MFFEARRFLPLLSLVLLLSGCGAAEDGIDEVTTRAGLSGSWSGTWKSDSGKTGVAQFHLEQKGLELTGTITMDDNECFRTGTLSGRVEGLGVAADMDFGRTHVKYTASLMDGAEMSGLYESLLEGGPCEHHRGVLSFVK